MTNAPDGRRIHHWCGMDQKEDIDALAAAVAAAVPGLCSHDGVVARLDEKGGLNAVSLTGLRDLIGQALCEARVVHNGAGWKYEYYTFQFDPVPHPGPPTAAAPALAPAR